MLTSSDIVAETRRLLNQQVIGVSTVAADGNTMIYISDGTGLIATMKATDADLSLPMIDFSRTILAPALKGGRHAN